MRSEQEIQEAYERAALAGEDNSAYLDVAEVLQWVLEYTDQDPSEI